MSAVLLSVLLLAQGVPSSDPLQAATLAFGKCTKAAAVEYLHLNETAESTAKAAIASCPDQARGLQDAFAESMRLDGLRVSPERARIWAEQAKQDSVEALTAFVMRERAKAKPRP